MKYLSVTEVAEKWNLSERTIRNYCADGKIVGAVRAIEIDGGIGGKVAACRCRNIGCCRGCRYGYSLHRKIQNKAGHPQRPCKKIPQQG